MAPLTANSQSSLEQLDADWAWDLWRPSKELPWSLELAAHLYRRAGFGATWEQLQWALDAGPRQALNRLLDGEAGSEAFYQDARQTVVPLLAAGSTEGLPAWWLYKMVRTPHPLREKITLFWHGHFATSAEKVDDARQMYRQHTILHKNALGPFGPMLREASKDPAMLLWLDAATNHKAHPNENFAREVMELFTLGLGNYTETDIKEAARAFTGWELRRGRFWFNAPQHDSGSKTVLGQRGKFDGDAVLDLLLKNPATARFLVSKLYRYLVSDTTTLPPKLLKPLAAEYRNHDYDTFWLLRRMLGSNLFYSRFALHQKIKSPVDLAVGLLRTVEGTSSYYVLADDLRELGQGVFYPPNVKGWDGGQVWINSATLLGRANLVWALLSGSGGYKKPLPVAELIERHAPPNPAGWSRWLADLLLARTLPEEVYIQLTSVAVDGAGSDKPRSVARVVHALATLPEFQLG